MRKEDKAQIIESMAAQLKETPNFYVADIEGLNAEATSKLRRACFEKEIKLVVVKNTLFFKALEMNQVADYEQFASVLSSARTTANRYLKVPWFRTAHTLVLTTLRHLLTSSLVRNLSVISSVYYNHLYRTLFLLLHHRAVAKLQAL